MKSSYKSQKSYNSHKSQLLEGSQAIAQVVTRCKPGVISAYPITPQTHIVEELAKLKSDGAGFEYAKAESEFDSVTEFPLPMPAPRLIFLFV